MAEFSKEYYEKKKTKLQWDFSIEEKFQKLKPNTSAVEICEGFGEIRIIDRDEECYIEFKDGSIESYEELTGRKIEKKDNRALQIGFIVVGAWLISWLFLYLAYGHSKSAGEFGDMFGATNALFSGLAFVGVIYAIILQRKELRLQRSELRLTREEFKTQNNTLAKQRFENTFFQMIDLHHKIIDKLKFHPNQKIFSLVKNIQIQKQEYYGREVFDVSRYILTTINKENSYDALTKMFGNSKIEDYENWKLIQKGYRLFYYELKGGNSLSHYFMNIYQIFKLIYLADYLAKSEKKKYASIVRAQLTESELFILLYNGMFENHGNPKFLYLMGEYKILDNMNPELVEQIREDIDIFNELIKIGTDPFLQENPPPIVPPLPNIEK